MVTILKLTVNNNFSTKALELYSLRSKGIMLPIFNHFPFFCSYGGGVEEREKVASFAYTCNLLL